MVIVLGMAGSAVVMTTGMALLPGLNSICFGGSMIVLVMLVFLCQQCLGYQQAHYKCGQLFHTKGLGVLG